MIWIAAIIVLAVVLGAFVFLMTTGEDEEQ